jgi:hypothetical protein
MSFADMKYLVWLLSAVNAYFGSRCFLNAIHVLHTSKYSQTSTTIFAFLFLTLGLAGFYFGGRDPRTGLLIAIGPWVLGLAVLFFSAITGDHR